MDEEEFYALGEPADIDTEPTENLDTELDEGGSQPIETDTPDNDNNSAEGNSEGDINEPEGNGETQDNDNEPDTEPEPKPQVSNEQLTQQLADLRAKQAEEQRFNQEFQANVGKYNPYTGQVIHTVEDYRQLIADAEKYKTQAQARDFFTRLQNGEATQDDFQNYIDGMIQNSPEMQASKKAQEQLAEEQRKADEKAVHDIFAKDIADMNKEYPDCKIKNVNDIENDAAVNYFVRDKKLRPSDAYFLAHRKDLLKAEYEKGAAAAKQATINQTNSKGHLKATQGGGGVDDVTAVPEDTKAIFRQMNPDWTDKQILEAYKKYK